MGWGLIAWQFLTQLFATCFLYIPNRFSRIRSIQLLKKRLQERENKKITGKKNVIWYFPFVQDSNKVYLRCRPTYMVFRWRICVLLGPVSTNTLQLEPQSRKLGVEHAKVIFTATLRDYHVINSNNYHDKITAVLVCVYVAAFNSIASTRTYDCPYTLTLL